jgi:DNA-binding transcriptional regulator YiaG
MNVEQFRLLAAARRHATDGSGRRIRQTANLTLAEVAAVVGVSEPTVSRWEEGLQRPRTDAAIRWAKVLAELQKNARAVA